MAVTPMNRLKEYFAEEQERERAAREAPVTPPGFALPPYPAPCTSPFAGHHDRPASAPGPWFWFTLLFSLSVGLVVYAGLGGR